MGNGITVRVLVSKLRISSKLYEAGDVLEIDEGHPRLAEMLRTRMVAYCDPLPLESPPATTDGAVTHTGKVESTEPLEVVTVLAIKEPVSVGRGRKKS